MNKNNVIIFGVKTGDTYHYIGKTKKVNPQGGVSNSYVCRQYTNSDVRNVFVENNDITIEKLKVIPFENWYDEKLDKVVEKYQNNHPLLNARWMVEGKRGIWEGTKGYWYGKKRDKKTLTKLSESKYKKIVEYDFNGYLKKIWNSGKEVGINVFKDYRVINGGGKSKIYKILDCSRVLNHFSHGSYWFKYEYIYNKFNMIPKYINIFEIQNEEFKERSRKMRNVTKNCKSFKQYTIIHYKPDGSVETYKNIKEAAYKLKTTVKTVQRICTGKIEPNENYVLKYGEKIKQPRNIKYPDFDPIPITHIKKKNIKKQTKKQQRTRTKYTVKKIKNGVVVEKFNDVKEAAYKLKLKENVVRRLCVINKSLKYPFILRYGEKKTIYY